MITRRQFLQYCAASAAALGLSQTDLLKLEKALATPNTGCIANTPRVIWMSGQACTACQVSLLNRVVDTDGSGYYDADMLNALYSTTIPGLVPNPLTPVNQGTPNDPQGLYLNVVNDVTDLVVGDAVRTVVPQLAGARALNWADDLGGVGILPNPNPFPNGFITLEFITTVQASAGELSIRHLVDVVENHPFILLIDGSVPSAPPGDPNRIKNELYCIEFDNADYPGGGSPITPNLPTGDITMGECLRWMCGSGPGQFGANCLAVINTGVCSSYGGIPAAQGQKTGSMSVPDFLTQEGIVKPIINVPGCPPHPDWMVYPVAYFLVHFDGSDPMSGVCALDQFLRPVAVFSGSKGNSTDPFCVDCPNEKKRLDTGLVASKLGDAGCLGPVGCKGPYTVGDCPIRQKNTTDDGIPANWCVGAQGARPTVSLAPDGDGLGEARHPCQGCIMPDFPDWSALTPYDQKTSRKIKGFYNN